MRNSSACDVLDMETPTRPSSPPRPRSPRPKGPTRRSSRCENFTVDPLQALLSDPSSPKLESKSSLKGLPRPARRKSPRIREFGFVEIKDSGKDVRRVSFGDTVVDVVPTVLADDDVVDRGRSKDRRPGKRNSTPFASTSLSSFDDVDEDGDGSEDMNWSPASPSQAPETRTASLGSHLAGRKSSRTRDVDGSSRETFDHEKERRVSFAVGPAEYLPGDSSDEEVYERGRGRERGPGKRSCTPFVRRSPSSRDDVDDDDDATEGINSPQISPRETQETSTASNGLQLPRRKNSRIRAGEGANRESCDRENVRRVNFADGPAEWLQGYSSDEEVHERGRGRDRRPGKRSSTPFVRRRFCSLDDVDEDDATADLSSPRSPTREAMIMVGSPGSQGVQRKASETHAAEGASSDFCDHEKVRRVNFAGSPVVEYLPRNLPGNGSDEGVYKRGRGRDRGPGKRSATPFRRRSNNLEDDVDTDDTCSPPSLSPRLATKALGDAQPVQRKSTKYENGEHVRERHVNFVECSANYVPGDSSDEEIVERGRRRGRGPGKRSATPFARRSSYLSEDDGIVVCERRHVPVILSFCNISGIDVEARN